MFTNKNKQNVAIINDLFKISDEWNKKSYAHFVYICNPHIPYTYMHHHMVTYTNK